jgi:hypothetical protein
MMPLRPHITGKDTRKWKAVTTHSKTGTLLAVGSPEIRRLEIRENL